MEGTFWSRKTGRKQVNKPVLGSEDTEAKESKEVRVCTRGTVFRQWEQYKQQRS